VSDPKEEDSLIQNNSFKIFIKLFFHELYHLQDIENFLANFIPMERKVKD